MITKGKECFEQDLKKADTLKMCQMHHLIRKSPLKLILSIKSGIVLFRKYH